MITKEITWSMLRFEMTTSQLIKYADYLGIKLTTTEVKHKKKIAKEIWKEIRGASEKV